MNHPSGTFPFATSTSPPLGMVVASLLVCLAIDVVVILYCLDDLNRRGTVPTDTKRTWTAVIILGGPLGQMLYWLYER